MSDVIEDIKRYQPASLKVTLGDGTEKAVAVPKNRTRWSRTAQVLDALAWVHIECLDKDGRLLGTVENDDVMDALVEEGGGGADSVAMARVLVDVMRSTMKETRLMFETQMKGNAALVEALIGSLGSIAQSYEMSMQVQRAAMVTEAGAAAGGGNPEMMALLQLALSGMNRPQIPAAKPAATGAKQ